MERRIIENILPHETDVSSKNLNISKKTFTHRSQEVSKRCFDFAFSSLFLILSAPLFALVALLVAMDGGPVFFRHARVGREGRMFDCWKFRTMIIGAEACLEEYLSYHPEAEAEWRKTQKLEFDPRVTPIGKFLRHSSLDELPQLLNVLFGEMSLVGPRPVTMAELKRYGTVAPLYMSVRPGITGLWQVSGRNDTDYDKRVALDESYVRSRNMAFDLLILWRTVGIVLTRKGAR